MPKELRVIGLEGMPIIKPGDDLPIIILEALKKNGLSLESRDILVISQTIVSKSNGLIMNLRNIKPSERAIEIYNRITPKAKEKGIPIKRPELIQIILDESKEVIKAEHVLIVETKHGFVCANAGVDKSNVEGEDNVTLLPENSDEDAEKIRKTFKKLTKKDVAVIVSDSFGRPFREGAVGTAIGVSGINSLLDFRGKKDLFGYTLQSKIVGHVDSLASAAQLVSGESNEGIPVVLIRGYKFKLTENASIKTILRKKDNELFIETNKKEKFYEILKNRRSYKLEFDSKLLDTKIIEECVDVSRWAPSAHNGQFWRYMIIEKGKFREDLINKINEKWKGDLTNDGKTQAYIKDKIATTRRKFMEAPYLILTCLDTANLEQYSDSERSQNEYIMGVQSVSASITYLLLAFEINQLAACWYCAPLFAKDIVKSVLHLPDSFVPMAFISVGHSLNTPSAPPRKTLEEIVFNLKMNEK